MRIEVPSRRVAAALLAALPLAANAVHMGDGQGQVLIFPYYTVNGDLATLFQVSNLKDEAKALKVRFMEGNNGREVLSFNLYLGPHDTWTGSIWAEQASDAARLTSVDPSCTVPQIPANGVDLRNVLYGVADVADGGSSGIERAREGHFEILEMGVVGGSLGEAVTARNCTQLRQAWVPPGGVWSSDPGSDIAPPTGALHGAAALVAVAEGVMYSYRATALDGFSGIAQHSDPAELSPHLGSAAGASVDAPVVASWIAADGNTVSASWPRSQAIDAMSAVLARARISNSFTQEPGIGADSEWILNFPTKPFYTDTAPGGRLQGDALAPFDTAFAGNAALTRPPFAGGACSVHRMDTRDRDGTKGNPDVETCFTGSPCGPARLATCYVTQVVAFGAPADELEQSPLLGSERLAPLRHLDSIHPGPFDATEAPSGGFAAGHATLAFDTKLRPSQEGIRPLGLPVIALGLERIVNQNALPGRLANYAAAVPHSGHAEVAEDAD